MNDIMKYLLTFLLGVMVAILICVVVTRGHLYDKPSIQRDTVTMYYPDTSTFKKPAVAEKRQLKEKVKLVIPTAFLDSLKLLKDSLKNRPERFIDLPREQLMYKDTSYQAWISGVQPRLDSLKVFRKTVVKTITNTITIKDTPKRWGIGIQAGYGINSNKQLAPYIGVGISYQLVRW